MIGIDKAYYLIEYFFQLQAMIAKLCHFNHPLSDTGHPSGFTTYYTITHYGGSRIYAKYDFF